MNRLANLKRAGSELLLANNSLEQRGFTNTVGTNHANNAVSWQAKREVVDKNAVAKGLVDVIGLQDLLAQTRTHRNLDLGEVELLGRTSLCFHLLIAVKTRVALCLASLRRRTNPLQLSTHFLCALGVLLVLSLETCGLVLQVS